MFTTFRTISVAILSLFLYNVAGAPSATADASTPTSIGGETIGEIINLLNVGLVSGINTDITLDSLTDNLVSAGLNGTVFATFTHTFDPPVVVPILGTANSGEIDNVLLVQGATATLNIIPFGVLNLMDTNIAVRAGSIFGIGGIPLTIDGLVQNNVPTTYTLDLTGD
ncbi:hypothetical protein BDP27DRAFT_1356603 [Rhodocollybia butyracea]|uniref:Uncharacterized protein n=1 Tax=Rhodocollybia butyracea TaxID=206335 RepID=A0A9P5UGU8_9AGAR|nr:hypothetical protein BDP27DRAFT_1356603 [Rhodocollybia butyracea]